MAVAYQTVQVEWSYVDGPSDVNIEPSFDERAL